MKKCLLFLFTVLLCAAALAGCSRSKPDDATLYIPPAAAWEGEAPQSVIDLLETTGYQITRTSTDPSILHGQRYHMELNGDNLHAVAVYQYESAEAAQAEAACIGADGYSFTFPTGEDTAQCVEVDWVDTPHFYLDDSRIILYIGQDPVLLDAFAKAWGTPIAGAE